MAEIRDNVFKHRASTNTVYHCLYGYYFLGLTRILLAKLYGKSHSTITNWINRYERDGIFSRKEREKVYLKFSPVQREWLIELYHTRPILMLEEAKRLFERTFSKTISTASICRILHAEGLSYKCIERRAIQLREDDILRFVRELQIIKWDLHQLLFLDEVSCDNRGILRTKGYAKVGERLIIRGEFVRRPRVSMLSFLGQTGLVDTFWTEGTFNRLKFFNCCRSLANSGRIQRHPGVNSVWIMDGARIHCDKAIIFYLRSLGIHVIFLPAYAPFFNPIEFIFGYLKRFLKKTYVENSKNDMTTVIAEGLQKYNSMDCTRLFGKCGYFAGGLFDPSKGLSQKLEKFGFNCV